MKILFYLAAGSGDLINFTGILLKLKELYPTWVFDFLVKKKHSYIIENHPAINKILYFDEYSRIPDHCTKRNHDEMVKHYFKKNYNHVLNVWGCKLDQPHSGDFVGMMAALMKQYQFMFPFERSQINPIFFFSQDDYKIVDSYAKQLEGKTVILIEDECFSWNCPQLISMPGVVSYLRSVGYIVAANHLSTDVNIKPLNLKQLKLFHMKYCYGFLGISSGISCAIYSKPNDYEGKLVVVSGIEPNWDIGMYLDANNRYAFFQDTYTLDDVKILFRGP